MDNQVYDASVSSLRSFVETYRASDTEHYAALDEKVRELEAMRTRARVIGVSTALIGAGVLVSGFLLYKPPTAGSTAPVDSTPILVGACVGIPLVLFSYWIGKAFGPSRTDYMDFVNFHNRLKPDQPVRWQLGVAPGPRGPSFSATLTF